MPSTSLPSLFFRPGTISTSVMSSNKASRNATARLSAEVPLSFAMSCKAASRSLSCSAATWVGVRSGLSTSTPRAKRSSSRPAASLSLASFVSCSCSCVDNALRLFRSAPAARLSGEPVASSFLASDTLRVVCVPRLDLSSCLPPASASLTISICSFSVALYSGVVLPSSSAFSCVAV